MVTFQGLLRPWTDRGPPSGLIQKPPPVQPDMFDDPKIVGHPSEAGGNAGLKIRQLINICTQPAALCHLLGPTRQT